LVYGVVGFVVGYDRGAAVGALLLVALAYLVAGGPWGGRRKPDPRHPSMRRDGAGQDVTDSDDGYGDDEWSVM
jgi:hypothetical protein